MREQEITTGGPMELPLTPEMARALAPTGAKGTGWRVLQWASLVILVLVVAWAIYAIPHGGIVVAIVILVAIGWLPALGAWWGRRALRRMAADVAAGVFMRCEGPMAASGGQVSSIFASDTAQTYYEGVLTVGPVRLKHRNERITKAAAQHAAGAVDYAKVTTTILELRDAQGAVIYRHPRLPR